MRIMDEPVHSRWHLGKGRIGAFWAGKGFFELLHSYFKESSLFLCLSS